MNVKALILCSLYVIAFYPDRGKRLDGNFHQLSVQVSGGMTVSLSRRGYAGKGAR